MRFLLKIGIYIMVQVDHQLSAVGHLEGLIRDL